jgi:hypothetical protein
LLLTKKKAQPSHPEADLVGDVPMAAIGESDSDSDDNDAAKAILDGTYETRKRGCGKTALLKIVRGFLSYLCILTFVSRSVP